MDINHSERVNGAFAVLLTADNYFLGVKVLNWSLKSVRSEFPLVVLYTTDTLILSENHIEDLRTSGCIMKPINSIVPIAINQHYAQPYYLYAWTKLEAFNLTEYSRVVLLDADMLVRKNIDDLMTLVISDGWIAASSACICNPMKIPSYPTNWCPENCPYMKKVEDTVAEEGIAYFNAGLIVLTPSKQTLDEIKNRLANIDTMEKYNFAEQDFLNEIYAGKWHRLSYVYNALRPLILSHPDMWNYDEIKNIHYIFKKPWLDEEWKSQSEDERKLNKFYLVNSWWYDAFEKSKT